MKKIAALALALALALSLSGCGPDASNITRTIAGPHYVETLTDASGRPCYMMTGTKRNDVANPFADAAQCASGQYTR